jgi:hypothetical protein
MPDKYDMLILCYNNNNYYNYNSNNHTEPLDSVLTGKLSILEIFCSQKGEKQK